MRRAHRLDPSRLSLPFFLLLLAAFFVPLPSLAEDPGESGGEDLLLAALQQELARSSEKLRLEGMARPFFVEYLVIDREAYGMEASFGALVRSGPTRDRPLRVNVRVGSYELDNTAFQSRNSYFRRSSGGPGRLVVEDQIAALRHDLWLATDAAYKRSLEQLAQKRAFIETRVEKEEIPDFSREEPVQLLEPASTPELDVAAWEERVRRLSALFREYPEIQSSSVILDLQSTRKYLLNSEGTVVRQGFGLSRLYVRAGARAPDGAPLRHFVAFHGTTPEALPGEEEMTAAVRTMAGELSAMVHAPELEDYVGPVLMSGQASAELFLQLLAPNLSGDRPPLVEDERFGRSVSESRLASRLKRRVLSTSLSVMDDPLRGAHEGQPLLGSYRVDDQGVEARRVLLADRGILKTLLMSRRPRPESPHSNGHGRALGTGQATAWIGNLIVEAREGRSPARLKEELIDLCRAQEMPYGLIIELLDISEMSGGGSADIFSMAMSRQGAGESLTPPLLVYRVWVEDGREELVRGATFGEITVRSLRDILAVGNDPYLHNRLTRPAGSRGGGGASGIPASIIAPSVLMEEMELKAAEGPQERPVLLAHPFFEEDE